MKRFQLTGELPRVVKPASPLITYLESLGQAKRLNIKRVKLSPILGYQSNQEFSSAQFMLIFLKPDNYVTVNHPTNLLKIQTFTTRITDELFFSQQEKVLSYTA